MRVNYFGDDLRNDVFNASSTIRESFFGRGQDDTFNFYNGASPFFDQDFSDRFIGGAGNDLMTGLDVGFNGYTEYGMLSFDGGAGYDTVQYTVTGTLQTGDRVVMDLSQFTTLERSVEHHRFDISAGFSDGITASFAVQGSAGDETVRLDLSPARAQAVTSTVDVTIDLGAGSDRFEFVGQQRVDTLLRVHARAGDDTIIINDATIQTSAVSNSRIWAGGGADTVVLEGMHKEIVKLGGGADTAYVLTGGFADAPDVITTGKGADRIFLELDEYSTIARIKDFDPNKDMLVFDATETRNTDVTFDKAIADAATAPMLYMDTAAGDLYFGSNLLVHFVNDPTLTMANFTTGDFLF